MASMTRVSVDCGLAATVGNRTGPGGRARTEGDLGCQRAENGPVPGVARGRILSRMRDSGQSRFSASVCQIDTRVHVNLKSEREACRQWRGREWHADEADVAGERGPSEEGRDPACTACPTDQSDDRNPMDLTNAWNRSFSRKASSASPVRLNSHVCPSCMATTTSIAFRGTASSRPTNST